MAITVGELIGVPSLGTRVVAGAAGLDRRISWAHVCELPEPWLWLGDGELLLTTGIGVPVDVQSQVDYVVQLSAAGVVGIAIGDRMTSPDLHPEMLAAASAAMAAALTQMAPRPSLTMRCPGVTSIRTASPADTVLVRSG